MKYSYPLKQCFMLALLAIVCQLPLSAQTIEAYPTNWFVQMKYNKVQILLRKPTAFKSNTKVQVNYPGVNLLKTHYFANPNYLAVDVEISKNAKPGEVKLWIQEGNQATSFNWTLKNRRTGNGTQFAQGVNSKDFIYFLMPDRFSNGDKSNDKVAGLKDQSLNRDSIFLRHGGDLQGVLNHLDYLHDLGVTSLWMTPVLENDMPNRTEHGYAATNQYAIEKRFGGEAAYLKLSDALHQRGMKLIQDIVYNHSGRFHFLVQDAPDNTWVHQWPKFTEPSHKEQVIFDPYASKTEQLKMTDGWFTPEMPDLNHSNPFMAKFLTQNAIWSVETFGVDGFRIDTYKYNDLVFMNQLNQILKNDFPSITSFGESWVHGVAAQAYFVENNMNVPFKSNLEGGQDFQTLFYGILPALNENFGWTDGVTKLYTTLSNDFLYKDASRNVLFLDNHDMTRILSSLGESVPKLKVALAWLFTCRGIPQLYYGTEVMMKGIANPDGWVRLDFPGGWEGDQKNAFTGEGLTTEEKSIQDYTRLLGNYRKQSTALQTGKMMQFIPNNGLYVYFRYDAKSTVMCVMNTDKQTRKVDMNDYLEQTKGFNGGKDIITNKQINTKFEIPAMSMQVIELTK
jgi:neopullulanase